MTRNQVGFGVTAFSAAALESALMVARTSAIVAGHPWAAATWDAILGALILVGVMFVKRSNRFIPVLVAGYFVGTWLAVRFG